MKAEIEDTQNLCYIARLVQVIALGQLSGFMKVESIYLRQHAKGSDMKAAKKVKLGTGIVLVVLLSLFFHYNLPRTVVVQISGTDVKRIDKKGTSGKNQGSTPTGAKAAQQTADVRFINSMSRSGKTIVFRNEDTGWGWPPYLKFDSADLTAEAQAFAADQAKPWVLVKYYGWRIKVFSMFPNAVNLKVVDRDYSHFPLFNIVFFVLLTAVVLVVRSKIKKIAERLRGRNKSKKGAAQT